MQSQLLGPKNFSWASKIVILGNPKPKNAKFVPDVVDLLF